MTEAKQCFNCEAKFDTDEAFWEHIYHDDCGSSVIGNDRAEKTVNEKPSQCEVPDHNPVANRSSPTDNPTTQFDCALCGLHFSSNVEWYAHSKSDEHRNMVATAASRYAGAACTKKEKPATEFKINTNEPQSRAFCDECHVPLPSNQARIAHIMGKKHQKVMNRILKDNLFNSQPGLGVGSTSSNSTSSIKEMGDNCSLNSESVKGVSVAHQSELSLFCDYCRVYLPDQETAQFHVSGKQHKANMLSCTTEKTVKPPAVPPSLMVQLKATDGRQMDELINVLRRLCLAQLTCLMYELERNVSAKATGRVDTQRSTNPSFENAFGLSSTDLLELFRAVCREELQLMLSSRIPRINENTI